MPARFAGILPGLLTPAGWPHPHQSCMGMLQAQDGHGQVYCSSCIDRGRGKKSRCWLPSGRNRRRSAAAYPDSAGFPAMPGLGFTTGPPCSRASRQPADMHALDPEVEEVPGSCPATRWIDDEAIDHGTAGTSQDGSGDRGRERPCHEMKIPGNLSIARDLRLVPARGLEPLTPTMSRWCSSQLS
jgi:hypothetical protein